MTKIVLPPLPEPTPIETVFGGTVLAYSKKDLHAHAAAELAAARDCRACRNYSRYTATCWTLERHHHMAPCTNADRYEALPPVRLWRTT